MPLPPFAFAVSSGLLALEFDFFLFFFFCDLDKVPVPVCQPITPCCFTTTTCDRGCGVEQHLRKLPPHLPLCCAGSDVASADMLKDVLCNRYLMEKICFWKRTDKPCYQGVFEAVLTWQFVSRSTMLCFGPRGARHEPQFISHSPSVSADHLSTFPSPAQHTPVHPLLLEAHNTRVLSLCKQATSLCFHISCSLPFTRYQAY